MIPLVTLVAAQTGYNPMVLGLATVLATNGIMFYPAQSVTVLQAYEGGWIRSADLLKTGLVMSVLVYLVTVWVAVPWWSWLGYPLR